MKVSAKMPQPRRHHGAHMPCRVFSQRFHCHSREIGKIFVGIENYWNAFYVFSFPLTLPWLRLQDAENPPTFPRRSIVCKFATFAPLHATFILWNAYLYNRYVRWFDYEVVWLGSIPPIKPNGVLEPVVIATARCTVASCRAISQTPRTLPAFIIMFYEFLVILYCPLA